MNRKTVDDARPVGNAPSLDEDVFVFPATVGQRGFWYLDQLRPGDPVYNVPIQYRLQGPLRVEVLKRALNEIVRRHEVLRTSFATQNGDAVQVVAPHLSVPLPIDDLSNNSPSTRDANCEEAVASEGRKPFVLTKGPLVRARLFRLNDQDHVLVITFHHIIVDGWSLGLITDELAALYNAYVQGLKSPLGDMPIQYGDFAVWQNEWLRSPTLDKQLDYWIDNLRDLPNFELPPDQPYRLENKSLGAIESRFLPQSLRDNLATMCRQEKVTPFMVTLATFMAILQRYTGKDDIVVGSVQAGRNRPEVEPLVGLFINPLVLRTDFSGNPTFRELLGRVRETVLEAFTNQDVPFGRVVDAVQPRRDPTRHPLFQINFLHQRAFLWPREALNLTLTPIPSLSTGSMFDLNFFLIERAEGLRLACDYKTELYSEEKIRELFEDFQALLTTALADPSRRITELLHSEQDKTRPLSEHNSAPISLLSPHSSSTPRGPVEPRDPVEAKLVEIWERLLRTSPVRATDDFFDLGGHSLLAMRLLTEVNRAFGKRLTLSTLIKSPTIEAMAACLRSEKRAFPDETHVADEAWVDPETRVFPLRREGIHSPLLLVDAGLFFRPLVRALGNDQPAYGIGLPELSELPEQFDVRDIASNLVDALLDSIVEEPYFLAGWSAAGVIAYEMAQQLSTRGKNVANLILLDTTNPTYHRSFRTWKNFHKLAYFKIESALYQLRKMSRMPHRTAWHYFRQHMSKFNAGSFKRVRRRSADSSDEIETAATELWQIQYLVALEYSPQPCDFPLTIIRSSVHQKGLFRDPCLGWKELARGGLQIYEMPGEHDEMFLDPKVNQLAEVLAELIRTRTTDSAGTTWDTILPK